MLKHPTLSKAINDVGWSEFVSQLEYKADWYGRILVKIDKWYPSSKRCFACARTDASQDGFQLEKGALTAVIFPC